MTTRKSSTEQERLAHRVRLLRELILTTRELSIEELRRLLAQVELLLAGKLPELAEPFDWFLATLHGAATGCTAEDRSEEILE